jgi:hypothetical protein
LFASKDVKFLMPENRVDLSGVYNCANQREIGMPENWVVEIIVENGVG